MVKAFAVVYFYYNVLKQRPHNMKPDILNSLIAIAIILFIVSVIVEKIVLLIRRYSPFFEEPPKANAPRIRKMWRNINKRQTGDNGQLDKIVEREVTSLAFVVGTLISLVFRVDLFKMIVAEDPRQVLFWSPEVKYSTLDIVLAFVSVPLTGFFLSFGSKFFHDLLDMLLQVKNLKRKLVDDETFKIDNIQQFDTFLNTTNSDVVQKAIAQNINQLNVPNATSPPMHGKIRRNGKLIDCIDIHLKDSNRGALPLSVQADLGGGKIINIPINAVFDVEIPTVMVAQGDTNANEVTPNFKGTVCCKIKRNNIESLLTCSHVFTGGTDQNFFGDIQPAQPANINNTPNGNYTWAICTNTFDMALLTPATTDFTYALTPGEPRGVTPADNSTTHVSVVCNNEVKEGMIINNRCIDPIKIKYSNGNIHGIENLIVLSAVVFGEGENSYTGITLPGNSGACVYDDNNKPIGMIVAGNNRFSYAIPMTDILNHLTATIIN